MGVPSVADVNQERVRRFKAAVKHALEHDDLSMYRDVAEACQQDTGADMADIAAALARLSRGGDELFLSEPEPRIQPDRAPRERPERGERRPRDPGGRAAPQPGSDEGLRPYRIEVGNVHGVRTGNIVGAIANESGIDASRIGRIRIREQFTLVDLPGDLPEATLDLLKRVRVAGQALDIRPDSGPGGGRSDRSPYPKQRDDRPPRKKPGRDDSRGPRSSGRPSPRRESGPVRERWKPEPKPEGPSKKGEQGGEKSGESYRKKGESRDSGSEGRRPPKRQGVQSRAARKAGHTDRKFRPKPKSK
jgi:ATP-dependent RNA helicase DeaD